MTIDRRGVLAASSSALAVGASDVSLPIFEPPSETPDPPPFLGVEAREVAVFTTAGKTDYRLPSAKQREILGAYFDPNKGIGYTLGRTHIHSCDFSSASYTYVDEGDTAACRIPFRRSPSRRRVRPPFVLRCGLAPSRSPT